MYDSIKAALKQSTSWKEFENKLNAKGIAIAYKYRSGTDKVQGLSFEKGDLKMKGSAIDRGLSFARIDATLSRSQHVKQYHEARQAHQISLADSLRETIRQNIHAEHQHSPSVVNVVENLLDILLRPEFPVSAPDPVGDAEIARRKRKKHKAEQSQSVSR